MTSLHKYFYYDGEKQKTGKEPHKAFTMLKFHRTGQYHYSLVIKQTVAQAVCDGLKGVV